MRLIAIAVLFVAGLAMGCTNGGSPGADEGAMAAREEGLSTTDNALIQQARAVFSPVPDTPPEIEGNPASEARVHLGKMLFFEPRLSASWLISCNTCHNVGMGGVDLLETSVGHGWQKGPRNAPTVLNAVFNLAQFWDGRAEDLAAQAQGPVQAGVEMNSTPDRAVRTLKSIPEYVAWFQEAFPGEGDPVTFDNMALAIEVFEATLITPNSPLDRFLKGDASALSEMETHGLETFIGQGCTACHNGVNLGGAGYFPFGLVERPDEEIMPGDDLGRFAVTRQPGDEYVFKSPSLRNITLTAPYFHSGKIWDLSEAVRIMGKAQLGADLGVDDVEAVVAYLGSLVGDQPVVEYPILPRHTNTTPLPDISVGNGPAH